MQVQRISSLNFGISSPVHNYIREHMEAKFDITYFLSDDNNEETSLQMSLEAALSIKANSRICNYRNECVDKQLLSKYIRHNFSEKIKGALYSGSLLNKNANGPLKAKEAGIKTVVSLVDEDYYQDDCEKAGLNFIMLDDIGSGSLNWKSIFKNCYEDDLLTELIKNPQDYATHNYNGTVKENARRKILDLQKFEEILLGENKKYPYPIYFGCVWGVDRTSYWYGLFTILQAADPTEPLDQNTVENLKKLKKEVSKVSL